MNSVATFIIFLLPLSVFGVKNLESPEEKICKKDLVQFTREEATLMLGEGFPADLLEQMDPNKELKCDATISPNTFVIADRTSTFCQATADFVGECFFPKKGGGFLTRTHKTEGSGCCKVEE